MKAKSVKRAFGLAAAAVSTSGAMMLAPAVANAATTHPAHAQTVSTVSNVSKASGGFRDRDSGFRNFGFRDVSYVQRDYRHPHGYYGHGYRHGYYGHGYRHGYYGRGNYGGGYGRGNYGGGYGRGR